MTTRDRYHRVIREHLGLSADQLSDDAEFAADLKAASLDMIELCMALEEEFALFQISEDDAEKVRTVADGLALVERLIAGKEVA